MPTLSLLVPGLFDTLSAPTVPVPPSALLTLLARARQRPALAGDCDELLLRLFGLSGAGDADAPVAALSRLGETDAVATGGYWLRADPVHLRADQARLLMFGPDVLAVQPDEARTLAAAFNAMYSIDGWRLETPHPQRWYLQLPDDPQIRTRALHTVIGRNIDSFLPQGINGRRWHRVLNEVQMLLHDNPVNTLREEQGRLAINSVWFWGGGYLPTIKPQSWTQVCSVDPFARGVAVAAGVAVATATDIAAVWSKTGGVAEQLVVVSQLQEAVSYGDSEAWNAALMTLEHEWFTPALAALQSGRLDELRLYPGNDCSYQITRADLRRFWRRRHALDWYNPHHS